MRFMPDVKLLYRFVWFSRRDGNCSDEHSR
jgi:hypothetical protein